MTGPNLGVGDLVRTPTGRPGVIVGFTYGARGDLPRASVRYLDKISEEVPLQVKLLRPIECYANKENSTQTRRKT